MYSGNKIQLYRVTVGVLFTLFIVSMMIIAPQANASSNCTGPTFDAGTRTLSLVCTESTDIHELSCSDVTNPDTLFLSVNGLAETITCPPDVPPNTGPVIAVTGPISVGAGTTHTFTVTGTDAEGDALTYQVDWDNNSVADYVSGSLPSGTGLDVSQSWAISGSYTFGARGIDVNGASSTWTTHTVTVTNDTCLPNGSSYQWNGSAWAATAVPTGWNWNPTDVGINWNQAPPAFATLQIDDVGMDVTREWMNNYGLLRCGIPLPAAVTTIEAEVNGGGSWGSGDVTINPGDDVVIRWTGSDSDTCTGTNVNTGGATNSAGVGIAEPASGSSLTYTVSCTGPGGTDVEDIVITTRQSPNLTEPSINFSPSGTVDPVTGNYTSVGVTFQTGNNGGSDTGNTATYRVEIDYGNNGSYDVSDTGTIANLVPGGNYNGSETFINVPFGNNTIRVTIDSNNDVTESDETDNVRTLAMTLAPTAPNLQLSVDKEVVRQGQTVTVSWDTAVSYSLNCSVSGPALSTYNFNPSVNGTTGSRTTTALSSKSEYLLSCTEPITNTTFTETISVEVTPTAEEI